MASFFPVPSDCFSTPEELHRRLAAQHAERLSPRSTAGDFNQELEQAVSLRRVERGFVESERLRVAVRAHAAPTEAPAFTRWFEDACAAHERQASTLYDFLAREATFEQAACFVDHDLATEPGFDGLTPLLELPIRGVEHCMQRAMLGRRAQAEWSGEQSRPCAVSWQSLALGNLMIALASERHYAYQSHGARSALEHLLPWQARCVAQALSRVGVGGAVLRYYEFSSNAEHARSWQHGVLAPLVQRSTAHTALLAEGVVLRLDASTRAHARLLELLRLRTASFEYAEDDALSPSIDARADTAPSSGFVTDSPASERLRDDTSHLREVNSAGVPLRRVQWRDVSGAR